MPDILDFASALGLVLQHAATLCPPRTEQEALAASLGRVLGEPLRADRDQPPFNRSTRDGFAVRADGWSSGQHLRVTGQVRAGEQWSGAEVAPGTAIEIMTGAPVPPGADSVAMVEHAEQNGGEVRAAAGRQLSPGENIVPRGAEARAGDVVLPAGTRISPAEIALAASCGAANLTVYKRPVVSIVATGDELVELTQTPADHQIRNSNSYGLAALVQQAGGQPERLRTARDRRDQLEDRIIEARAADLVLLSGGVSAGKYDLVEEVLADFGAEFLFTGVKMQPGKPVVFGRMPADLTGEIKDAWIYFFGLPGNPISTQVTFHCFVHPIVQALCGNPVTGPTFVQATLAEDVRAKPGLTRVLPAVLKHDVIRPEVRLVTWQGSGDLAANARANSYAVLPDGRDLKSGDIVTVLLR